MIRSHARGGRVLKESTVTGYKRVSLSKGGIRKDVFSHRVIWEAFNGLIPEGLQINHKNGIKADNRLSNLEVVSPKENVKHAILTGLFGSRSGKENGFSILTDETVLAIRRRYDEGWTIRQLNRTYGISCSWDVVSGVSWAHLESCQTKKEKRGKSKRRARGERVNTAKMTEEKVAEARRLYESGGYSPTVLARLFGISLPSMISIVKGHSWKHLL